MKSCTEKQNLREEAKNIALAELVTKLEFFSTVFNFFRDSQTTNWVLRSDVDDSSKCVCDKEG
ncbi:hypothetical protein Syun_011339 [Stephania yunnanensis]|uniref:Uncharacterized protein n=1 Tax=Stephania yunnanensis TaxID=152371 RepID=A0AAP0PGD3_9MAGN